MREERVVELLAEPEWAPEPEIDRPKVQPIEAPRAAPPPARVHAVPAALPTVQRCEIKLWRGYVKCQLYAPRDGAGEEAWATSPSFRLREEHRTPRLRKLCRL